MLRINRHPIKLLSIIGLLVGTVGFLSTSSASASSGMEITVEEYRSYRAWVDGKEDPRLAKLSDEAKLKKIARQEKLKLSVLKTRIAKVEPVIGDIGPDTQQAIRNALSQTVVASRVREIEVNTDSDYVVAYVKWECGDKRDIDTEAAYVAWAASQSGEIIKVLGLWCVNSNDTKLYSAQIGREGFMRIAKRSIPRFARSRYVRLFQGVKRGPHK